MDKSSINVQPVKGNSEVHNLRKTELDYVYSSKTHLNKSIVMEEIGPTRKRLEDLYKEKTGQKMQQKATPIREAVVIVGKKNTMNDLVQMCGNIEKKLGIKTMQIHLHEDEGHQDRESGKFKQNRHAHIVFNWVNEETGKSWKLKKQHMAEMQTIVAESLGLQRGQSSDKKHLHSMEFKAQAEFKNSVNYQVQASEAKKEYKITRVKHKAENISHEFVRGVSETFKRLGGVHEAKKLKESLESTKQRSVKLHDHYMELKKELQESVPLYKYNEIRDINHSLKADIFELKELLKNKEMKYKKVKSRVAKIYSGLDKDGESQKLLRESVKNEIHKLLQEEENKGRSKGKGMSF
jgi:hypothetical protein